MGDNRVTLVSVVTPRPIPCPFLQPCGTLRRPAAAIEPQAEQMKPEAQCCARSPCKFLIYNKEPLIPNMFGGSWHAKSTRPARCYLAENWCAHGPVLEGVTDLQTAQSCHFL